MKGQQQSAGESFDTMDIGGKEYTLRPLTIGQYGQMEAYLVSKRDDPISVVGKAAAKLPKSQRAELWDAAVRAATMRKIVSASDMALFESSLEGIAWKLWQCVKADHPEVRSVEDAAKLMLAFGKDRYDELKARLNVASGEAAAKN